MGALELIAIAVLLLVAWLVWRLARRGTRSTTTVKASRPAPAPLTADVAAQAWELQRAGKKIHAIKLVREHTGLGLAEAKTAVERLALQPLPPTSVAAAAAAPDPAATAPDGFNELELEGIRSLVAEGRTIEAIKLVRERTGLGLAEAKDLVERLAEG